MREGMVAVCPTMRCGCGVSESDPEMGQGLFTGCYAIGVSFGERFETLGVRVKLENFLELRVNSDFSRS